MSAGRSIEETPPTTPRKLSGFRHTAPGNVARVVFRLRPHVDDPHVGPAQTFGEPAVSTRPGMRSVGAVEAGCGGVASGVPPRLHRRGAAARKNARHAFTLRGCPRPTAARRASETGFKHRSTKSLQAVRQQIGVAIAHPGQHIAGLGRMGHAVGVQDDRAAVLVRCQSVAGRSGKGDVDRAADVKRGVLGRRADVDHDQVRLALPCSRSASSSGSMWSSAASMRPQQVRLLETRRHAGPRRTLRPSVEDRAG